jgi:hypothetical protein
MALSALYKWEVRTTGSDNSGGGFRAGAWIAPPAAPACAASSGGAVAAATYYLVTTYTDVYGETGISGETSVTTTAGNQTITVTSPVAAASALTWSVYGGTTTGGPYFPQGTGLALGTNRVITATPPTTGTQPCGIDYSQQDAAQINVADGVTNGTTTITSATAAFSGAHVGNAARIINAWYDIISVTNATTIIVDRTITTGTAQSIHVGGAMQTPGRASNVSVAGNTIFIKAGTYTLSATSNANGGRLTANTNVIGYNTTRTLFNSDAARPELQPAAIGVTLITLASDHLLINNLLMDNPSAFATCAGIANGAFNATHVRRVKCVQMAAGFNLQQGCLVDFCEVANTASGNAAITVTTGSAVIACDVHDGGGIAIGSSAGSAAGSVVVDCNAWNITVPSTATAGIGLAANCAAIGCNVYNVTATGAPGISLGTGTDPCWAYNCVVSTVNPATGAGYGYDANGNNFAHKLVNCAGYNNKTAHVNTSNIQAFQSIGFVACTADPFTSASAGNFALNATVGAGALLRAAGYLGVFPAGLTAGYQDIGAAQHLDSGGSGGGGMGRGSLFARGG